MVSPSFENCASPNQFGPSCGVSSASLAAAVSPVSLKVPQVEVGVAAALQTESTARRPSPRCRLSAPDRVLRHQRQGAGLHIT